MKLMRKMLVTMLMIIGVWAVATTAWGDVTGKGTEAEPYLIGTAADLKTYLTPESEPTEIRYIELTSDITVTSTQSTIEISNGTFVVDMKNYTITDKGRQAFKISANITFKNGKFVFGSSTKNGVGFYVSKDYKLVLDTVEITGATQNNPTSTTATKPTGGSALYILGETELTNTKIYGCSTVKKGAVAYVTSTGKLTISGENTKIYSNTSTETSDIYVYGTSTASGQLIINSGTFINTDSNTTIYAKAANGGTITVNGGWFSEAVDSNYCGTISGTENMYTPTGECADAPDSDAPYTVATKSTYTITYMDGETALDNTNGLSGTAAAVNHGTETTILNYSPTGKNFSGWKTADDISYSAGNSVEFSTNTTLYAVTTNKTVYTIKYYDGADLVYTATVEEGIKTSAYNYLKDNSRLSGWKTSSSATKIAYAAEAEITPTSLNTTENVMTLYAVWADPIATVTYNSNIYNAFDVDDMTDKIVAAGTNAVTVTLQQNITISSRQNFNDSSAADASRKIVFDANKKVINVNAENGAMHIKSATELTITGNGAWNFVDTAKYYFSCNSGTTINVLNGKFSGAGANLTALKANGGTLAIKGGTFDADPTSYVPTDSNSNLLYNVSADTPTSGLYTVSVAAVTAEVDDGEVTTYYGDFTDAWTAALTADTATISLTHDVTLSEQLGGITTGKNIILDLNGKSITTTNKIRFISTAGTFTIKDDQANPGQIIYSGTLGSTIYGFIHITGGTTSISSVTIKDDSTKGYPQTGSNDSVETAFIKSTSSGTLKILSGSITAKNNTRAILAAGTVNISGGTITGNISTSKAMTISGGTITGNIISSAALKISGGTITGSVALSATTDSYIIGGSISNGITLSSSGNVYISRADVSVTGTLSHTGTGKFVITGGKFTSDPTYNDGDDKYYEDSYKYNSKTNYIEAKTASDCGASCVATINGVEYSSLSQAILRANQLGGDQTITLTDSCTGLSDGPYEVTANITFDLNRKTISSSTALLEIYGKVIVTDTSDDADGSIEYTGGSTCTDDFIQVCYSSTLGYGSGRFTLENGTITDATSSTYTESLIAIEGGGSTKIYINGGAVTAKSGQLVISTEIEDRTSETSNNIIINGGTVVGVLKTANTVKSGNTVTNAGGIIINDGTFNVTFEKGNNNTISITGGHFSSEPKYNDVCCYDINLYEWTVDSNDADSDSSTEDGDVEVKEVESSVASVSVKIGDDTYYYYPSLKAAILKANKNDGSEITITLLKNNANIAETYEIKVDMTIDLNGKSITLQQYQAATDDTEEVSASTRRLFSVTSCALTIKNSSTDADSTITGSVAITDNGAFAYVKAGTLTLGDGTGTIKVTGFTTTGYTGAVHLVRSNGEGSTFTMMANTSIENCQSATKGGAISVGSQCTFNFNTGAVIKDCTSGTGDEDAKAIFVDVANTPDRDGSEENVYGVLNFAGTIKETVNEEEVTLLNPSSKYIKSKGFIYTWDSTNYEWVLTDACQQYSAAEITGIAPVLSESISLRVYYNAAKAADDTEEVLCLRYKIGDRDEATTTVGGIDENGTYFVVPDITPAMISEDVTVYITYRSYIGASTERRNLTEASETSVEDYCKYVITNKGTTPYDVDELQNLVKAVLIYGSEAIKYRDSEATGISDYNVSDESYNTLMTLFPASCGDYSYIKSTGDSDKFITANLLIGEKVSIIIKYNKAEDSTIEVTLDEEDFTDYTNVNGVITTRALSPTEYNSKLEITLTDSNRNTAVLTYSVNSYCVRKGNDSESSAQNLAKAMYLYGQTAEAYETYLKSLEGGEE